MDGTIGTSSSANRENILDLSIIKELLALMDEGGLTELTWEKDDVKVHLSRKAQGTPVVQSALAIPTVGIPPTPTAMEPAASPEGELFLSPLVGTFYQKPNPDSDNFVKVGDSIKPESVLCIIEAMKVFNEIPAEAFGEILEILAKDGESVEYDQPLFRYRKA